MESRHSEASIDINFYLSHPIHAYTFIRRFRQDWTEIDENIFHDTDNNIQGKQGCPTTYNLT